jgi:hypothetical protein
VRARGAWARLLLAFLCGLVLVLGEGVPGGPPAAVAEAHASCDGADHWEWHWTFPWPHKDHWVYVRSRSTGAHRYQNYFWNETHGYGEWSQDCPS